MAKSRKTSFVMALIFVLSSGVIFIVVQYFLFSRTFGIHPASSYSEQNLLYVFASIRWIDVPVVILLASAIISLWINTLSDSHFGFTGGFRWALMGIIYGIAEVGLPILLLPFQNSFADDLFRSFITLICFGLSYIVVFKVPWTMLQDVVQPWSQNK